MSTVSLILFFMTVNTLTSEAIQVLRNPAIGRFAKLLK
jgi:hypothetical protein